MEKGYTWQDYVFLGIVGVLGLLVVLVILQNAGFITQ